ncbi:MAG: tetratricopeptide repeat protein [Candidatus Omnitrophica bacterium]|nr:tetratricopeptide repeat protein [Candidatus Omnitrophota bacterium]
MSNPISLAHRSKSHVRLAWSPMFLMLVVTASFAANPFKRDIAEPGNQAFKEENYEKAASEYVKAQDLEPLSAELNFNLGSAYYRQDEYDRAMELFEKSTRADDISMAAKAYYNLGNARYKASKRDYEAAVATAGGEGAAGGAVQDYVKKLEQCIKDYEETLKRTPEDEDAKYNLEMIRREIKNLMRRQPPQDQQQQQEEQKESEQEQNQQDQGQQEENKEDQNKDSEEKNQQQQEQQQQQASQQQGEEGTPTPQPQPGEGEPTPTPAQAANLEEGEGEEQPTAMPTLTISEEMARNLLDNLPEQRPRTRRQQQRNVEKDW